MAEEILATNYIGWPDMLLDQVPPFGASAKNAWCTLNSYGQTFVGITGEDADGARYWSPKTGTHKELEIGTFASISADETVTLIFDADFNGLAGLSVINYSTANKVSIPATTGRQLTTITFKAAGSISRLKLSHATGVTTGIKFYGARLHTGEPDEYGVFSGVTVRDDVQGRWTGEAYNSISELVAAEKPTPPIPPNPADGLAARAIALLKLDAEDSEDVATAAESINAIRVMVKAYTRGNGFRNDPETGAETIADDLEAVILTAGVRYLANPSGLTYRAGTESITSAFQGWTLAETFVLNSYRKRWA